MIRKGVCIGAMGIPKTNENSMVSGDVNRIQLPENAREHVFQAGFISSWVLHGFWAVYKGFLRKNGECICLV